MERLDRRMADLSARSAHALGVRPRTASLAVGCLSTALIAAAFLLMMPMLLAACPPSVRPLVPTALALLVLAFAWAGLPGHVRDRTEAEEGGAGLRMARLCFLPVSATAFLLAPSLGAPMLGCGLFTLALPLRTLAELLLADGACRR